MSIKTWIAFAALSLGAAGITACATSVCEDGEQQCSGEQIQTCVDGQWGDAEDCATAGEACMTMDSGLEHCMGSM